MTTSGSTPSGYTLDDRMGDLLADPAARAVIEKYVPDVGEDEWIRTSPGLRLHSSCASSGLAGDAGRVAVAAGELAVLDRPEPVDRPETRWPG